MVSDDRSASTRRGFPRWLLLAVPLVLVGVGLVAWLSAQSQDGSSDGQASPTASAPYGSYRVAAGQGGSALASDERTPVGYGPACQDAAAAASNYVIAVQEGLFQDRLTRQEFAGLLAELNGGLQGGPDALSGSLNDLVTEFDTIRAEATEQVPFDPDFASHPEWGGFLVRSCDEEAAATVEVISYTTPYLGEGVPGYAGFRVSLSWFEGDWRLVDFAELDHAAIPEGVGGSTTAPPLAADRKAWLADAGSGWMEYTNAPQD